MAQALDWPTLWNEHQHWLRTVVGARVREAEAIEDVMQELGLAVSRRWPTLRNPEAVGPWLYRLAVRQALLYRRNCGRRRRLQVRYQQFAEVPGSENNGEDPLNWLIASERRQLVRHALARLSPRDAEILLLKYSEQWTYQQIAARIGVSHSAVEARLHRARQRLRSELAVLEVIENPV